MIRAKFLSSGLAFIAFMGGMFCASAVAQSANKMATFSSWSLNSTENSGNKMCFVASSPVDMQPPGANRGLVALYVSAWPKQGVKSEVSVKMGYPLKANSNVSVKIGSQIFSLFSEKDRGFVADATQELKLVEAMKRGNRLTVTGTSSRGTETTDTYSLSGVTSALNAMAKNCP